MRDVEHTVAGAASQLRPLRDCTILAVLVLGTVEHPLAQEPKSVRAVTSADPYTEASPAAMAKAGYVSFGPFPIGSGHDTRDVMALLGDEPLLWIETAHFRIGCALSPLPLRGDQQWIDSTKDELKRLKVRLPKLNADTRELDPWLRTHLVAQRCEELYGELQSNLGVRDDSFPDAPGNRSVGNPRLFFGIGPYLGNPGKFAVLIMQRVSSLARYTRTYQGRETPHPRRYFDCPAGCMIFSVAEESTNGLMKDDFALYTHLVYNLAFSLYNSYRYAAHDLPPWLVVGLAHWHGRRICPRFPAYERAVDDADHELRDFWRWDERAPGLLRNRAFEPIETLMERADPNAFGIEQHIQSWAFVDFLMTTRKIATMQFLHDMKAPFHELKQQPSHAELLERAKTCLASSFRLDAAGLEAEWRTRLLRSRKK